MFGGLGKKKKKKFPFTVIIVYKRKKMTLILWIESTNFFCYVFLILKLSIHILSLTTRYYNDVASVHKFIHMSLKFILVKVYLVFFLTSFAFNKSITLNAKEVGKNKDTCT